MYELQTHDAVDIEVLEASDWYESKQSGLCARFLNAVATSFEKIETDGPDCPRHDASGLRRDRDIRRLNVHDFP